MRSRRKQRQGLQVFFSTCALSGRDGPGEDWPSGRRLPPGVDRVADFSHSAERPDSRLRGNDRNMWDRKIRCGSAASRRNPTWRRRSSHCSKRSGNHRTGRQSDSEYLQASCGSPEAAGGKSGNDGTGGTPRTYTPLRRADP